MKMKTVIKNSSCTCIPRYNENPLLKSCYFQKKPQKFNALKQQKLNKYSGYNLRDFNKTITLKNYQSAKIYSPIRNTKNIKRNPDSNLNSQINNFHYLIKTKNSISKCPNYNCDNYQYFYNFYLNNPSPNTLPPNFGQVNSNIIQNFNPSCESMEKSKNLIQINKLNSKKKIYQRPKQKINSEIIINNNSGNKNNYTNFDIIYDNKSAANPYSNNNTESSNDQTSSMLMTKKYILNDNDNDKVKNIVINNANLNYMNSTREMNSFYIYDSQLPNEKKYNKATLDINKLLRTKKLDKEKFLGNKSTSNFYQLNRNDDQRIYVKKNNKFCSKKNDKKNNNNSNNIKYMTKGGLYYKEIKKFFLENENSKKKLNIDKKKSNSIFDNVEAVQKNITLIQSFYRRHLGRMKYCILKIMSNFIEGFNFIEDVFFKQNFKKMKNNIDNLYPKNENYCIKTKERLIPKFNNKDLEKLNTYHFNDNKKMIYYCLELPSNDSKVNHNIIEDITKGKIKIKNENEKFSEIKNNFNNKKTINLDDLDLNRSCQFEEKVNNEMETSNFINVINTEENNIEKEIKDKSITFGERLFPKKYNKKLVKSRTNNFHK